MSTLITDLVTSYRFGLKQLYYMNTHDSAGDKEEEGQPDLEALLADLPDDEDCDGCTI